MLHCDADPQVMLVDVFYTPGIIAVLILGHFMVEGDVEGGVLKKQSGRC